MSLKRELDSILNISSILAFQICFTCRILHLTVSDLDFYSVFSNDVTDVKRHKRRRNFAVHDFTVQ